MKLQMVVNFQLVWVAQFPKLRFYYNFYLAIILAKPFFFLAGQKFIQSNSSMILNNLVVWFLRRFFCYLELSFFWLGFFFHLFLFLLLVRF